MMRALLRVPRGPVRAAWLAVILASATSPASAAQVTLHHAWMRPAPEGAATARVYVDIQSDTDVDLVGARTPHAKKVVIVRTGKIDDPSTEKVVAKYAVPAGTVTRLAYRGDHLRLVNVTSGAQNGSSVPMTLVFRDRTGRRTEVATQVTVRGFMAPVAPGPRSMPLPPPEGVPKTPEAAPLK